ncbi:hypothetical protein ACHAXM_003034 [Skeletonema potamos]|jgi:hypothetical protein
MEGGEEVSVEEMGVSRTSVVGTSMAATASSTSDSSDDEEGGSAAAVANGTGGGSAAQPGKPTTTQVRRTRTPAAAQPHKCSIKGCKLGKKPVPFDICSASECARHVHVKCYEYLIVKKSKGEIPRTDPEGESANLCFCTLTCYRKYMKANDGGTCWHNDGKNGADDQNCSENLLVKLFLSDQQKYSKFRDPFPDTKIDVCKEWAEIINSPME